MIECPFCDNGSDADSCTHWYGGFSEAHDGLTGEVSAFENIVVAIFTDWVAHTGTKVSIDDEFGAWVSEIEWDLQNAAKNFPPPTDFDGASDWIMENLYLPTAARSFADFFYYECVREATDVQDSDYTEFNPDDEDGTDDIPGMSFGSKHIWVKSDHKHLTQQIESDLMAMRSKLNTKWASRSKTE